jgi:hypothetical protein
MLEVIENSEDTSEPELDVADVEELAEHHRRMDEATWYEDIGDR